MTKDKPDLPHQPTMTSIRSWSGVLLVLEILLVIVVRTCSVEDAWAFPKTTHAVVTGGTKGIGHAIVTELAGPRHKCRVLTCSRKADELQACVDEWKEQGMDVEGVVADVSTPEGRDDLLRGIGDFLGDQPLDILVNNVGSNIRKPSVDYSDEEFTSVLNTNFASMFHVTTACHSYLKRTPGETSSSVVNIGSVAGVTCIKSGTPYAATKAAMNQVTGNWACEWGPEGIRVNCVAPWYINTPLAAQVLKNDEYRR